MNITTTTTTIHSAATDDGDEFPLHFQPVDWPDAPVIIDIDPGGYEATVGYLVLDDDRASYEWQEGVEFVEFRNGDERDAWAHTQLEMCARPYCYNDRASHTDENRAYCHDHGFDPPCDEFLPHPSDRLFWVDRFEHGLVRYTVRPLDDDRPGFDFDLAPGAGVLTVPEDIEPDRRAEFAAAVMAEYTDWRNGNVYGVVVERFSREHGTDPWLCDDYDDCWGYIGDDHALAELRAAMTPPTPSPARLAPFTSVTISAVSGLGWQIYFPPTDPNDYEVPGDPESAQMGFAGTNYATTLAEAFSIVERANASRGFAASTFGAPS
jgi:hypothetical protein